MPMCPNCEKGEVVIVANKKGQRIGKCSLRCGYWGTYGREKRIDAGATGPAKDGPAKETAPVAPEGEVPREEKKPEGRKASPPDAAGKRKHTAKRKPSPVHADRTIQDHVPKPAQPQRSEGGVFGWLRGRAW